MAGDGGQRKLAVLGSPISHSKSPAIHRAAYSVLGLDWSYEAIDLRGAALPEFLGSRDAQWHGLSLTMPLKRDILPLLTHRDSLVDRIGAANTVLLGAGLVHGFNTDVYGVVRSLAEHGIVEVESAQILGGGATAASVIVALQTLGLRTVLVSVRSPERSQELAELGRRIGVAVDIRHHSDEVPPSRPPVTLLVNTTPGTASTEVLHWPLGSTGATLFDVSYDPWPSALARARSDAGATVISGLDLLVNQAVGQIRLFVAGDQNQPLPGEAEVVAAMRAAVA